MSSTRKVLRLAKSHDMLEASLKSIHLDNPFLRVFITFTNINQACYLVLDNLLWLNSMGVVNLKEKATIINEWSNKFWLFSSILYLGRDLNDLFALVQKEKLNSDSKKTMNHHVQKGTRRNQRMINRLLKFATIIILNKQNHQLLIDTIKNVFDIVLPLSTLNYIKTSAGTQGLCGLISSLLSLLVVWDARYKLKP
jgi:peroxin-11B